MEAEETIDFIVAGPQHSIEIRNLIQQLGHNIQAESLLNNIKNINARPDYLLFVAQLNGQIVAFAELHFMHFVYEEYPRARLTSFCVEENSRARNIGSKFLRFLEAQCKIRSMHRMEITSNVRRGDAHRFYERSGYYFASKAFYKDL